MIPARVMPSPGRGARLNKSSQADERSVKRRASQDFTPGDPVLDAWMTTAAQIVIAILTRRNESDHDEAKILQEDADESSELLPRQ